MVRLVIGLTAWMAGTAIAVSVAWLGANVVVRNAGVGPGMPVINAAVLPSAAASVSAATPPGTVNPAARTGASGSTGANGATGGSASRHTVVTPSASATGPSPSTSASPSAGDVRAYMLTGGNVTLEVTGDTAQLVTAVPDAGYSVQTWSGTDWLRVDFSSGAQVSSLIASWYQHAPTVTVTN